MTEKTVKTGATSKWSKWSILVLTACVLVFWYFAWRGLFPSVDELAETVLDTELETSVRKAKFGRLLDELPRIQGVPDGSSLKILTPEVLQGFKTLMLNRGEVLDLREMVAEVLLWRDPAGEMKVVIEELIKDETQPDSLRKLAIHACTDQPLLSLVIQYSGVSAELRSAALQNSGDKKLLRRLVVGHFDRDLKYRAADRLCQFDKDWLGENVVRDMGADRFLRVQLMTNCFEGDNEVLGRVFGNKDEEDEIRVAALLGMAGYLERPFATTGYTDNLLMIAMDKTESSLVQSTALMIYSDKVAVQKVLSQIKREALYGVDN